ncbi:MAG: hypothetical protein KAX49_05510 [Halanaerobiales bacterium]|nr:hypothetical protein [Halanaerobiales bacterium]
MTEDYKHLIPETREFVEKYATRAGYKLNENEEILDVVLEGMARNKAIHGKRYCPCRMLTGNVEEDRPKICPCKWHKEEIEKDGVCHCQLYFAPGE